MAFQRCSSGGGSMPELNNIQTWLRLGGVTGSYATMQDILADTTALNKLMTSGGAVNYLVGCDDFIKEICASSNGMSAIGASNYCANSLLSHNNWLDGIASSEYVDSVLNVKVPIMTSNTTPSGECFASSSYSGMQPYYAFDGQSSTKWYSNTTQSQSFIGYKFSEIKKIVYAKLQEATSSSSDIPDKLIVEGSNDGTNYTQIGEFAFGTIPTDNIYKMPFSTFANYQYYRVKCTTNIYRFYTTELQFYGRADV